MKKKKKKMKKSLKFVLAKNLVNKYAGNLE